MTPVWSIDARGAGQRTLGAVIRRCVHEPDRARFEAISAEEQRILVFQVTRVAPLRDELITCLTRVLAEEVDCQVSSLLVEEVATGGQRSQEKRRSLNVFQRVFETVKDNLDCPRVSCLVLKCTLDVHSFGYRLCLTVEVNSVSALSSVALDCL